MTKVLITGAGGAIGAHVLKHLLDNTKWDIIATDSFRHKGYFDRITTVVEEKHKERVEVIVHDLTVPFTERQYRRLSGVDYIINLASLSDVQDSIDNPVPFIKNNIDITLTVLELARIIKPSKFIQFSTDEVYGPDIENGSGHPEWDIILPSNPYAASKASQEAIAISYWRSFGVPLIITNTMNNFGEMQGTSKFTAMIQKNIKNGVITNIHSASDGTIGSRYYLHSRNAADAVLFILNHIDAHAHEPGECDMPERYNIVGDVHLNNLELAQIVAKLMGKKLNYRLVDFHSEQPGHDLHYGLNGEKLKALGWIAPVDFEASMKNTIKWQDNHKEWMS